MLFQASVGINIETDHVAMAFLKASLKGIRVAAHAVHPFDMDSTLEEKAAMISDSVRAFMQRHRTSSIDVFLGIPRRLAILRFIDLPLAVKENLRATLGYEIEKYIPLPADSIYFDYQIISEDKEAGILKILLIVVRKASVDEYLTLLKGLGAGLSGIEIGSTATINCFSKRTDSLFGDPYLMICLEKDHMELNLVKGETLSYSRVVQVTDHETDLPSFFANGIRSFSKEMTGHYGPLKTALCGRASQTEPLNHIMEETDVEVVPIDLSETGIPSWDLIPAYGLALKGIEKVAMDINFLPVNLRKKASKLGYYTMFVLASLLIISILAWGGGRIIRQRLVLREVNAEIARLEPEIRSIRLMQERYRQLEEQVDYLNTISTENAKILNILQDLSQRIPENAWVRRLKFTENEVQIEGSAVSASELIPILETSPHFKDVEQKSSFTPDRDGKQRYRIGLKVK